MRRFLPLIMVASGLIAIAICVAGQMSAQDKSSDQAKPPASEPIKANDVKGQPEKSTREYGVPSVELDLAKDYLDQTGFITDWIIVGPFPNPGGRTDWRQPPVDWEKLEINYHKDFLVKAGGAKDVKPKLDGKVPCDDVPAAGWGPDKSYTWQPIWGDLKKHAVDIAGFYSKQSLPAMNSIAYLAAFINADEEKKVILTIGTDDGMKLWINGEFVVTHRIHRGAVVDDDAIPVMLRKGLNMILLRVDTDTGGWGAVARIVGKDFVPATGLKLMSWKAMPAETATEKK
ncbi:MAG: hypothetical protein HZA50_08580 [Planctomycetes bacterium]|nr:hypothetical protein [Planctomycetota bacterium]